MASSRRAGITPLVTPYISRRAGITSFWFSSRRAGITSLSKIESSARKSYTPIHTEQFAQVYYNPTAGNWLGVGTETKLPEVTMSISGVDIRPYLKKLKISRPFNGKIRLDCNFSNTYTDGIANVPCNLLPPGYNVFSGLIRQANTTGTRYLQMSISVAGQPWICPTLIPLPPSFEDSLSWSFEGRLRYLENSLSTLEDIVWDLGDRITSHTAQQQAGLSVGVSIISNYPNFTISRLDRGAGNALGPCDAAAKPMQAGRREIGESIVYQQAKLSAPKWHFKDRLNIRSLRKFEKPVVKNKFDFARIEPVGGTIGQLKSTKPGYNEITFNPPMKQVVVEVVSQFNCLLHSWDYYSAAGKINSAPEANFFNAAVPITKAIFIAEPTTIDLINLIEFSLVARGNPRPDFGQYKYTAQKAALQTIYGVQQEINEIQDSTILDYTTLVESGNAYLAESIRHVWGLELVSEHVNPHIEPGDTISVTDRDTNQIDELWFVDNHICEIDFEANTYSTSLECSHGEPGV